MTGIATLQVGPPVMQDTPVEDPWRKEWPPGAKQRTVFHPIGEGLP